MGELVFNHDIIAKFQFHIKPAWTYLTPNVNLTLLFANQEQTDPSIYISSHNEVKAIHRAYVWPYWWLSLPYFLQSYMLYILPLIELRRQMIMKRISLYYAIQSLPFGAESSPKVLERHHWLVQFHEKVILLDSMIVLDSNCYLIIVIY